MVDPTDEELKKMVSDFAGLVARELTLTATLLRKWIEQYWRKKPGGDPVKDVRVRAHHRGATYFDWNGLHCTIIPCLSDIDKARRNPEEAIIKPPESEL